MVKNRIAVILASSRQKGHTQIMVNQLLSHVRADVFDLLEYKIQPYSYEHEHKDDFSDLMEKLLHYDVLVLATPVYWYSMSAWLKTFLDRWSDCVRVRKDIGRKMRGKKLGALACGSVSAEVLGFFEPFKLTAGYMDMDYVGAVHVWSLDGEVNDVCEERLRSFSDSLVSE